MEQGQVAASPAPMPMQQAKKSNTGLVIALVFFILAAIGLGVWVAILLIGNGDGKNKTSTSGTDCDTTVSDTTETPTAPIATTPDSSSSTSTSTTTTTPAFDYETSKIKYSEIKSLTTYEIIAPITIDYTKDGKYIYVKADVWMSEGGGAVGYYYRENKKGASWMKLGEGQASSSCSEYSDAQRSFIMTYGKEVDIACRDANDNLIPE